VAPRFDYSKLLFGNMGERGTKREHSKQGQQLALFGVLSFSTSLCDYFTLSIVTSKMSIELAGMVGG
jgi:hypothetical protein